MKAWRSNQKRFLSFNMLSNAKKESVQVKKWKWKLGSKKIDITGKTKGVALEVKQEIPTLAT